MADELDFYEIMIANERISEWFDGVQNKQYSTSRKTQILQDFLKSLQESPQYIEEAIKLGVSGKLIRLIKDEDQNEKISNLCSQIISTCSRNPSKQIKDIQIHDLKIKIHELSLNEGFGAQIWVAALILSRYLKENQGQVRNMNVLEIGSGCGLCGLVVSKLGALQVTLTDNTTPILENLQKCMEMNAEQPSQKALETASNAQVNQTTLSKYKKDLQQQQQQQQQLSQQQQQEQQLQQKLQHTDVMSDSMFSMGSMSLKVEAQTITSEQDKDLDEMVDNNASRQFVEYDNTQLKYMDWQDSVNYVQSIVNQSDKYNCQPRQTTFSEVPIDDTFDVIIGSDVVYEKGMGILVAYVLRHRLSKNGQAYICCAVRDKNYFTEFEETMGKLKLQFSKQAVTPLQQDYKLTFIRNHDYEGGYLLYTIKNNKMTSALN